MYTARSGWRVEWNITAKEHGKGNGVSSHYRGSRWVLARIGPGGLAEATRIWEKGEGHKESIDAVNRKHCEESSSKAQSSSSGKGVSIRKKKRGCSVDASPIHPLHRDGADIHKKSTHALG